MAFFAARYWVSLIFVIHGWIPTTIETVILLELFLWENTSSRCCFTYKTTFLTIRDCSLFSQAVFHQELKQSIYFKKLECCDFPFISPEGLIQWVGFLALRTEALGCTPWGTLAVAPPLPVTCNPQSCPHSSRITVSAKYCVTVMFPKNCEM